jgi:hypothetical protein
MGREGRLDDAQSNSKPSGDDINPYAHGWDGTAVSACGHIGTCASSRIEIRDPSVQAVQDCVDTVISGGFPH